MTTNPYTTVSISGYNANPPADDGSQVASNEIEWAKHKEKLADPVKTAVESINTNVNDAFNSVAGFVPAGLVLPYAGTTAPTGYLLCDGSAVSRTTYADLFTVISTTYGSGDGSTTFNLPDITGRVVAGKEASATRLTTAGGGVDGDTLGATGGDETHALVTAELPAHSHNVTVNARTFGDTGGDDSNRLSRGKSNETAVNNDFESDNTGSGNAHANVQPTIILNYIIKV